MRDSSRAIRPLADGIATEESHRANARSDRAKLWSGTADRGIQKEFARSDRAKLWSGTGESA
ncbi:MAG: hypothetical protein HFI66_03685 [Lachnospiraceae bacterium]|nr:hypothetical protein [Lachnospiraceae bacterium]